MKIEIRKVEIRGAEMDGDLFDEVVGRITLAEDENKTETGWFPWGGLWWNLTAEIIIATKMIQYNYDTPPEVDKIDVSILFKVLECTNEEGNCVDVIFLDENNREISAEDVLVQRIEEYYYSNL